MQHPFSTFGGAAEFHTRIEKARYQKTDPTWSTLSGDAHDLLAQLLNADIRKVRPALSGGVHRVAVVCRTAVDVVCVTGGVCGCMCSYPAYGHGRHPTPPMVRSVGTEGCAAVSQEARSPLVWAHAPCPHAGCRTALRTANTATQGRRVAGTAWAAWRRCERKRGRRW